MQPRVQSRNLTQFRPMSFIHLTDVALISLESNHSAILAVGGGTITATEPSRKTDNF